MFMSMAFVKHTFSIWKKDSRSVFPGGIMEESYQTERHVRPKPEGSQRYTVTPRREAEVHLGEGLIRHHGPSPAKGSGPPRCQGHRQAADVALGLGSETEGRPHLTVALN